jgi:hypothetical protein
MEQNKYEILLKTGTTYTLPIYLDSTLDEMGVMIGFDGNIEQIEQIVNFTYSGVTNTKTIHIYSSVNPDKLRTIIEQNFEINWGDGTPNEMLTINSGINGSLLPSLTHTYSSLISGSTITIKLNSPWATEFATKNIKLPFKDPNDVINPLGTFSGATIPLDYLNDLDYNDDPTNNTIIKFMGIGQSRINELKKYGQNEYIGISTGITDNIIWSGYTIDNLYYRDYPDNFTMISGETSTFTKEEVINHMITRNEHFLGFIDEPTVYSDLFVDRGKQAVMEKNLRLSEIDNLGEMEIYGNGYFNIRKQ